MICPPPNYSTIQYTGTGVFCIILLNLIFQQLLVLQQFIIFYILYNNFVFHVNSAVTTQTATASLVRNTSSDSSSSSESGSGAIGAVVGVIISLFLIALVIVIIIAVLWLAVYM